MEQGHKVLFILIGLVIIACLLGWRTIPHKPAFIVGPSDNPDDLVMGESVPPTGEVKGPGFLAANVPLFFPPPLAHLNPVTTRATGT